MRVYFNIIKVNKLEKNCTVIVNPTAGRGRSTRYLPMLSDVLKEKYENITIKTTKKTKDATRFARIAAKNNEDIICMGGGRIKITEIDGISVEITGEEYTLITNHYDVPGIVAAVSLRLANHNINISNMRVFRKKKGLNAVMIVHTDQEVPESMIKELVDCNKNIKRVISLGII